MSDFGTIVRILSDGKRRACRKGWQDMFIYVEKGKTIPAEHLRDPIKTWLEGKSMRIMPHFNLHTSTGSIVVGWLASQTDMLANDWEILL